MESQNTAKANSSIRSPSKTKHQVHDYSSMIGSFHATQETADSNMLLPQTMEMVHGSWEPLESVQYSWPGSLDDEPDATQMPVTEYAKPTSSKRTLFKHKSSRPKSRRRLIAPVAYNPQAGEEGSEDMQLPTSRDSANVIASPTQAATSIIETPSFWVDPAHPIDIDNLSGLYNTPRSLASFCIREQTKLIRYLTITLGRLTTEALLKLIYSEIKVISPYKHEQFPYGEDKRPQWWPQDDLCRFIQPNHLLPEERVQLGLHFLRLRPTKNQLLDWEIYHILELRRTIAQKEGWTSLLHRSLPSNIEISRKGAVSKTTLALMPHIFRAAAAEEEYIKGHRDGGWLFNPPLVLNRRKQRKEAPQVSTDNVAEPSSPCPDLGHLNKETAWLGDTDWVDETAWLEIVEADAVTSMPNILPPADPGSPPEIGTNEPQWNFYSTLEEVSEDMVHY